MSDTSAEVLRPTASARSLQAAKTLAGEPGRREEIPIRRRFVRDERPGERPPLAALVSSGGRGGAVPLKLYLALIWRCSADPYSTDIQARHWAALLGLEEPDTLGARRITKGLDALERLHLVRLERRRGDSTVITLLDESGTGEPYILPSTAHTKATSDEERDTHRYFKIPLPLWTEGHVQSMSAAALAMLLVLLAERNRDGRPTWWSTERFPLLFDLSPTVRSKGTAELVARRLVSVKKELVSPASTFARARVRHTYKLRGAARPLEMVKSETASRALKKKAPTRKRTAVKRP